MQHVKPSAARHRRLHLFRRMRPTRRAKFADARTQCRRLHDHAFLRTGCTLVHGVRVVLAATGGRAGEQLGPGCGGAGATVQERAEVRAMTQSWGSIPAPRVVYVSDPAQVIASASGPVSTRPMRVGGRARGRASTKEVGLASLFLQSKRRSAGGRQAEKTRAAGGGRSAAWDSRVHDRFFECMCRQMRLTPSGFVKRCAEETYIFVDAEHLRTILEAMRGEVLTAEDALVVLDGRRYPFDVNDGSDTCWSIQTSRIARDCLQ